MTVYTGGPIVGTSASVTSSGTSVIPTALPAPFTDASVPDNCHTVIVYNADANNTLLVSNNYALIGSAITNGVEIPAESSITLAVGSLSNRMPSASGPGTYGRLFFLFDTVSGTAIAKITYVCGLES